MLVDIPASSLLTEALSIYTDASLLGIKVSTHISREWRAKLATPPYRDGINSISADPLKVGYLLGNSHRWDQKLCKYFTLRMFKFFITRSSRSKFSADDLLLQYTVPSASSHINLRTYDAQKYAPRFVMEGPALFTGNNRYITIKIKTEYPNVNKGPQEYDLRWINMRYTKDLRSGDVELLPLPKFKAKTAGRGLTTEGQIKGMEGQIANFSYCALANSLKELCLTALAIIAEDFDPRRATKVGQTIPFDLINLIRNRNDKYRLVTYTNMGPLFDDSASLGLSREFRINGDRDIYVVFGSREDINTIAGSESVFDAYVAHDFHLASINLRGLVDPQEQLVGMIFESASEPDEMVSFPQGRYVSWGGGGADVLSYEILEEDDILEVFGV